MAGSTEDWDVNYATYELSKLDDVADYVIKVREYGGNGGETRWLMLTAEQLEQLRAIMADNGGS